MRIRFSLQSMSGAVLVVLVVFGCVNPAFACGGRLRFRQPAGPFVVTFFTTPDTLSKGRADFSVAVERAGKPGLVEDAHVEFILTRAGGHGRRLVLNATHAQAIIKWMQAANFSFPSRGLWHVTIVVRSGQEVGECSGNVRVGNAAARHLTLDILPVPLIAILFVLHENRKRKYNRDRRNRLLSATSQTPSQLVHLQGRG